MFKAIAVDIDGTFLTDQRDYNRPLFQRILAELNRRHIRFIVASGDQYAFLKSLFPDVADELSYVAENGVLVVDRHDNELSSGELPADAVVAIAQFLHRQPETYFTLCTRDAAYVLDDISDDQFTMFQDYYTILNRVHSVSEIPEKVFKFAMVLPGEQMPTMIKDLNDRFAGIIHPTVSGYGAIDLIIPGMNKGNGLRKLLQQWQMDAKDLIAFGDNENDLSMFKLAGTAYAMANAPQHVKAVADEIAPSNNDQGVLKVLAQQLGIDEG